MALNKATLQTELETWMNNPVDTLDAAANAFADAYETYALDAIDVSGDGPAVLNKQGIIDAINGLLTSETPSTAAVKFETGLVAFWTGGTFTVLTPPPGTIAPEISANVTASIVPPAIATELTTIFTDISVDTTVAQKAASIATLLDTATKTVIVTCVGTNAAAPPPTISVPGAIS